MPILSIEIVQENHETIDSSWAQQIADAAGAVFGTEPGRTWVRLHRLDSTHYAEQGDNPQQTPRPVFVSVLQARTPELERKRVLASALARCIGEVCRRPTELVHILWLPEGMNRIAFGGTLREG